MSDYEEVEEHTEADEETISFRAHVRCYDVELSDPPPGWRGVIEDQSIIFYDTVEAVPAKAEAAARAKAVAVLTEDPVWPGASMGNDTLIDIPGENIEFTVKVNPEDIDITLGETP